MKYTGYVGHPPDEFDMELVSFCIEFALENKWIVKPDNMLSTEKSNKILAVLTILFTLSIPATVVAAIYGININLPGGIEIGPATFFGPFTSFSLLVIAAILPAVIMIRYFKRQRWIELE